MFTVGQRQEFPKKKAKFIKLRALSEIPEEGPIERVSQSLQSPSQSEQPPEPSETTFPQQGEQTQQPTKEKQFQKKLINIETMVSDIQILKLYLKDRVTCFQAGALKYFTAAWKDITTDYEIIQTITGLRIPTPLLPLARPQYPLNRQHSVEIDLQIAELLKKGVVVETQHENGEFISPIFLTAKNDGGYRLILNLKKLNSTIEKKKFKMQTLASILCLIRPNMYMAKLDIKDAYYSIPIHEVDQKLLKFEHRGKLYKYTVLPNGYTEGPRKFTKTMKPPLAKLRQNGVTIADYIDDLITFNRTFSTCLDNVNAIVSLLDKLGFITHPSKSIFIPSQCIEFLGVLINSVTMTVVLTKAKKESIFHLCRDAIQSKQVTTRTISRILGKFASSFIAVQYGKLHYRALERFKTQALVQHAGDFEALVTIPQDAILDIKWWRDHILESWAPMSRDNPTIVITSDASSYGWGASRDGQLTGGQFTLSEKKEHINILELKAALFALQSLCSDVVNSHILIKIDNTSAVAGINKMGSVRSIHMDDVIRAIWDWAIDKGIWLTATHIPGVLNVDADRESRQLAERTEWMLKKSEFDRLIHELQWQPNIDLFATRINTQLDSFCSFRPDPKCLHVDAFTIPWGKLEFYAFPPFICIPRVIQKIFKDKAMGILVVPNWPNQPWYDQFLRMSLRYTDCGPSPDCLFLPQKPIRHPLWKTLTLRAALVSGK